MSNDHQLPRRQFLKRAGASLAAPVLNDVQAASDAPRRFNILFLLTDQERHFDHWPIPLPGREALRRRGTTFTNHQIASCVCGPSRATIYTGQHMQHTGVFDNAGLPWQADMDTSVRTFGHMLRELGYHTAYMGKWHLSQSLHRGNDPYQAPVAQYSQVMKQYGFDDYLGVGDLVGGMQGGYHYDGLTTESAIQWLRTRSTQAASRSQPWMLAVNLVNPHDVMFLNTDPPGSTLQNTPRPLRGNLRPPDNRMYQQRWDAVPLAASRHQAFDEPGRPPAQGRLLAAASNTVGSFPFTDQRLRTYQDYYFNCMRDCDTHIVHLLQELSALGLDEDTIIVMSSDHGDHVGAHHLVGKGASAYREQNHVPMVVCHPAHPGGRQCHALTSHVDIAPTLLALTGLPPAQIARVAGPQLRGHSFAHLLQQPGHAATDAIRPATLFNYSMLTYYDSEWMLAELGMLRSKGIPEEERHRRARELNPDLRLRGAIRSVFDGRYRFSRYFSLLDFNRPRTAQELFAHNDVELFDLQDDPGEMRNLAVNRRGNEALILAMNARLDDSLQVEVGNDAIDYMPIVNGKVQYHYKRSA